MSTAWPYLHFKAFEMRCDTSQGSMPHENCNTALNESTSYTCFDATTESQFYCASYPQNKSFGTSTMLKVMYEVNSKKMNRISLDSVCAPVSVPSFYVNWDETSSSWWNAVQTDTSDNTSKIRVCLIRGTVTGGISQPSESQNQWTWPLIRVSDSTQPQKVHKTETLL